VLLVIFCLVTIITLGNFVDWLIGPDGQQHIKDKHLTNLYISVGVSDWAILFRYPATMFTGYADKLLGTRLLSFHSIFRLGIYSLSITIFMDTLVFSSYWNPHAFRAGLRFLVLFGAVVIVPNIVCDILSMTLMRVILRRVMNSSERVFYLLLSSTISLFTVYVVFVFLWSASVVLEVLAMNQVKFRWALVPSILGLIGHEFQGSIFEYPVFWLVFSIHVFVPMMTFIVVAGCGYALYLLEPRLRETVLLVLQRFGESKSGIFTSIAVGINGIVVVLTALSRLLG
jgi:hypothetical protein